MASLELVKLLKDRCNKHHIWGGIPFERGKVKLKMFEGRSETRSGGRLVENKNQE